MAELPLSAATRDALTAAIPPVQTYVQSAERMVAAAATSAAAAEAESAALQKAFAVLEIQLEALSGQLEKEAQAHADDASATVQRTELSIMVSTLGSLVGLVLGAVWLCGHLMRPIGIAVTAAEQLAQGDLTLPIVASGMDETRQRLQSLAHMQAGLAAMVRNVKDNAEQVATASAQIANGNQALSGRTEQQASALQPCARAQPAPAALRPKRMPSGPCSMLGVMPKPPPMRSISLSVASNTVVPKWVSATVSASRGSAPASTPRRSVACPGTAVPWDSIQREISYCANVVTTPAGVILRIALLLESAT